MRPFVRPGTLVVLYVSPVDSRATTEVTVATHPEDTWYRTQLVSTGRLEASGCYMGDDGNPRAPSSWEEDMITNDVPVWRPPWSAR